MTEKHYGGAAGFGFKGTRKSSTNVDAAPVLTKKEKSSQTKTNSEIEGYDNYVKAGKIAVETIAYAKTIVKKGTPLLELAEKIEAKIVALGGKPAFPVNLSINEIAAHYSPSYDDKTLASGLLKVDIGVHVEGFVADTAFSVDL